jgi:PST family polysaccharide transporter
MVTLRGIEYILSFLLVPYLLKTLGPSQYGAIAFMQGVMGYLTLIINYGFNMTAPRDIAYSTEKDWPKLFSAYFWAMVVLWLGSSLVFGSGYVIANKLFCIKLDIKLFLQYILQL